MASNNSFNTRTPLTVGGESFHIFSLPALEKAGYPSISRLPFSLKILLENLLRYEDGKTVRFITAARSTHDTFGVGTRIEMPSSLPFRSGITSPTAVAAPVVVGMIDSAAARARRRSLCGRSSSC